jgi:hypothetical protein
MKTSEIIKKIKFEKFYKKDFEWNTYELYEDDFEYIKQDIYEFLEEFKDKINFSLLIQKCKVDIEILQLYVDKFDSFNCWHSLIINQKLSEKFIEEYFYKLNIMLLIMYQRLSCNFLDRHSNLIDYHNSSTDNMWDILLKSQKLDNWFIEKYKDKFSEIYLKRMKIN